MRVSIFMNTPGDTLSRRRFVTGSALLTTSALAGCRGGGNGGGDGEGKDEAGTATTRPARQKYSNYSWDQLQNANPTETTTITMKNTTFKPLIAKVSKGATITVTNKDSFKHTVVIPALSVDKSVSGGGNAEVTIDQAGSFDYVCSVHPPDMLGRIVAE